MKQVQEAREKEQKNENITVTKEKESKKRKVMQIYTYLVVYSINLNNFKIYFSGKKKNHLIITKKNQMEILKYRMSKKI